MVLTNLELTNFRLFTLIKLEFADGINLITGKNGCGKTSILESIYFLALTKSFRTSQDFQIIKYNTKYFDITGRFNNKSEKKKSVENLLFCRRRQTHVSGR